MKELEIMRQYFSTGSAAQEKNFIADVFVINDNFQDIIMPASLSIRLLVGSNRFASKNTYTHWESNNKYWFWKNASRSKELHKS